MFILMSREDMWKFIARMVAFCLALGAVSGEIGPSRPAFTPKFYRQFLQSANNIVVSPYSLCSAFTQIAQLSAGRTADEFLMVFGLESLQLTKLLSVIDDLNIELRKDNLHGISYMDTTIIFANSTGIILLTSVSQPYPPLDLRKIISDTSAITPAIVRRYIEMRTDNTIHLQVPPKHLGPNILLLVNAMVVLAEWEQKFYRPTTYKHRFMGFTPPSLQDIWVDMMTDVRTVQWKRDNQLSADVVEIPLRGGNLVFVMVLPHGTHGLPVVEKAIIENNTNLAGLCEGLSPTVVRLGVPKFKLQTSLHMKDGLRNLGVTWAFDPFQGNFDPISTTTKFHLSDIIHSAAIDVNEEGIASLPVHPLQYRQPAEVIPPDHSFVADHPFFFFVKHKPINKVLIFGKYAGP